MDHKLSTTVAGMVAVLLFTACGPGSADAEAELRTHKLERGVITESVSAIGRVEANASFDLAFAQPGFVEAVFVGEGDVVRRGDIIAHLNGDAVEKAIVQAEFSLRMRELEFERLQVPPTEADIRAARAAVSSAYANYQSQLDGPDEQNIQDAQEAAEDALQAYEDLKTESEKIGLDNLTDQQADELKFAEIASWRAQLQLKQLLQGPDKNAISAAQAAVSRAQAELDGLLAGPDELSLRQAELEVDLARVTLERAKSSIENLILVAPIDGIISQITIQEGALAPSGRSVVTIIQMDPLSIKVDVDEIDIARIQAGLPARISLDALPELVVEGSVYSVADVANSAQGVATYETNIVFQTSEATILPGMTVTVNIIVRELADVLLIPNWAVRIDRETGKSYASIVRTGDNQLEEVEIVLGLRSDTLSEVVSGLSEGDVVGISTERESVNFFADE